MRHRVGVAFLAPLMIAAVACIFAELGVRDVRGPSVASAAEDKKPCGLPPLVVDKDTPLLLEEPPELDPFETPVPPGANNAACYVCHADYKEEPLAAYHAAANVACTKCHGKSIAHADDEDNVTPPDVMFPAEKIQVNCEKCHEDHDVPAVKVIARWQKCCPDKTDPDKVVCTDCHGQHRMKKREIRWDKTTGKVVR